MNDTERAFPNLFSKLVLLEHVLAVSAQSIPDQQSDDLTSQQCQLQGEIRLQGGAMLQSPWLHKSQRALAWYISNADDHIPELPHALDVFIRT
eukprot:CAMPEP_0206135606 /NCGR_PEP_ID=MMETSP1473-20131121/877_1 /ASSEMBLY_ACC=CAM_ASM_001109 /TAXON_ID=1461547 /ORGANISM="Stichococcus sp, Strain RCC1054" /LENGTH=92 /DNA_ID=CAMNT_0053527573 /DNA_START=300 /DNA_END=575 /DNA_ORIENTATION=-